MKVEFAWYGTTSNRDKSGAYLFLPDGDAKVTLLFAKSSNLEVTLSVWQIQIGKASCPQNRNKSCVARYNDIGYWNDWQKFILPNPTSEC